jgi:peptidoglycan/LPS O-acetylase OafA/YrhL
MILNTTQTGRIHFLDGLRGWSAIVVLLYHVWVNGFPISKESAIFFKKIFIFNAYLAVYIFFITSGFSLTVSYFKNNDTLILKKILVGRYFRLIIPIGLASFICFVALHLGLILEPALRPELYKSLLLVKPSFLEFAKFHFFEVLYNFNWNKSLIIPLWTMQYEFLGSITLILSLLAIDGAKQGKQFLLIALIIALTLVNIFYGLFFIGALFAWIYSNTDVEEWNLLGRVVFIASLILTIFSYSIGVVAQLVCAIGIFFSAMCWSSFKSFLSTNLSIYLGKISFPLYLIHAVVMWVVGLNLIGTVSAWVVNVICVIVSLISAHYLVMVDAFSVSFSRKIGSFVFDKSHSLVKK